MTSQTSKKTTFGYLKRLKILSHQSSSNMTISLLSKWVLWLHWFEMTLPKKDASWFVYITFPPHEHCWSYWGPVGCLWFSDWSMLNRHAHLLWRNHDNLGCGCFKEAWKSYCCVQVVGYTCDQRLHICLGPWRPQIVCKWERWVPFF